jgi:hypothetical protein
MSASTTRIDERREGRRFDPDGVEDAHMRKLATLTQLVDGRCADAQLVRDSPHREEAAMDPSWTQRFVFGWCALGDSWIGLW